MSSGIKRRTRAPRVRASMEFGTGHALQLLEFDSGMRATVEMGQAVEQVPARPSRIAPPTDVASEEAGERTGSDGDGIGVFTSGEQQWFRNTFCNGSQSCVQGWDWAVCGTQWGVNAATGIAMVGSEGTRNATFTVSMWECVCVGPFCIGGHDCYWVEQWKGLVIPGHWLSLRTTASDASYLRWDLTGAGGDTQVSLCAQY